MAVIPVAPTLRVIERTADKAIWAFDLQSALNRAQPGDTLELMPGRYGQAVVMSRSGTAAKPITIRGPKDKSAIFDPARSREDGRNGGLEPMDDDFAFLKLIHTRGIVLENVSFENCWPTAVFMRSVKDITIRDCQCTGSRFFAFARQLSFARTRRLLIERVKWVQDPDHDMWDGRTTWPEVKARPGQYDASYFNGAFFGSFDIDGQVTIRDCEISHAFNGIRMDIRRKRIKQGRDGPRVTRNRDVAIYRNSFSFIRDNAIEPEMGAESWRIFKNRFFNNHAPFSLDGVAVRDVFIISNLVLNNRRPGLVGQENQAGKIFKFLGLPKHTGNMKPMPRKGLWTLFNSVQTRTSYSKKSRTAEWNDAYNAVGLYAAEHPENPGAPRPAFGAMVWNENINITGLATNDADYPKSYIAEGAQVHGFAPVEKVFNLRAFEIDPNLPLGGWNGQLAKSAKTKQLKSKKLIIERVGQPDLIIKAGLAPGYQELKVLGLSDWEDDGPLIG